MAKTSLTDGQVCAWMRQTAQAPASKKAAYHNAMLNQPAPDDLPAQNRLRERKDTSDLAHRDDIRTFAEFIDADGKRT